MKANPPFPLRHRLLIFLFTTAVYFLLGYFGLGLATIHTNSSPIWLCSGFAIGSLLLFGNWLAPGIFIGALATNLTVETPLGSLLFIAYGNALEALVGARVVKWALRRTFLNTNSELLAVLLTAITATFISAVIGVSALELFTSKGVSNFTYTMLTWWSGDAVGVVIVLPLFIDFYLREKQRKATSPLHLSFGVFLVLLIPWIIRQAFLGELNQAFCWVLGPMFIGVSSLLGTRLARFFLILFACYTVYLISQGVTPFQYGSLNLNLISVQSILVSFSLGTLFYRPLEIQKSDTVKFVVGNAIAWACLFGSLFILSDFEKEHLRTDLRKATEEGLAAAEEALIQLELIINSGSASLRLSPVVSDEDWEAYTDALKLNKRGKRTYALGIVKPVTAKQKTAFPLKLLDEDYAKHFSESYLITQIWPSPLEERVRGLDLGSERKRREALSHSSKYNEIRATEPLELEEIDGKPSGFLVFRPVFDQRSDFFGWFFMILKYEDFFRSIFGPFSHLLNVEVLVDNKRYFVLSSDKEQPRALHADRELEVFGVRHTLRFHPSESFLRSHSSLLPPLGFLLSFLIYLFSTFLLELMSFNQRSFKLVEKKSSELDSSRMRLVYSSKMAFLGEMASGIAHEINNPLSAILVKLEVLKVMLREKGISEGEIPSEVDKIQHITNRISKIVSGLRSFSRSSEFDPFEPTHLSQLVSEALDLCSEKFKAKGIAVTVKPIPEVLIMCRAGQIPQVLLNLLNNANDAIDGLPQKWILLDFKLLRERVQISVTDSGGGIRDVVAERLFEPFFTTKDPNKGTGLGLAISAGIINDHHGRIWLDRNHPHTRFVIELPTIDPEELGDG